MFLCSPQLRSWYNIVQLIGFSSLITICWTNIETLLSDQQVNFPGATNGKENPDNSLQNVLIKT